MVQPNLRISSVGVTIFIWEFTSMYVYTFSIALESVYGEMVNLMNTNKA